MGFLKRLFGSNDQQGETTRSRSTALRVDLTAPAPDLRLSRRDTPRTRDNKYGPGEVHVTGYRFVHADGGPLPDDHDRRMWRIDHGALDFYPSGVSHVEGDLLQSDGLQPSRRLTLVRDPDNDYDPNAVSLALEDGRHVGWVPRATAPDVAAP